MALVDVPAPNVRTLVILKVGFKQHLELLAQGKLRFRALEFYEDLEHKHEPWHDPNERVMGLFPPQDYQIKIGDHILNPADIVGPVILKASSENVRALCLHALHAGERSIKPILESDIPAYNQALAIPKSMHEFGDHVWVIADFKKFEERLDIAIEREKLNWSRGLVRYVDFERASGHFPQDLVGLIKSEKHMDEREYRIILSSHEKIPDPFVLDVGPLSDISCIVPLADFAQNLRVDFGPPIEIPGNTQR